MSCGWTREVGIAFVLALIACAGCVERELFIRSEPSGAVVFLDGLPRGETPLIVPFDSYGTRELEVRLADHAVFVEMIEVDPPWYQIFPLDFVGEVLVPWHWVDSRAFDVLLVPRDAGETPTIEEVLERAETLRSNI